MTTYVFDQIAYAAVKSLPCPVCGRKVRRQRTFTMTDNPWNRNPDGTRCSVPEIREALRAKASAWQAEPESHPKCVQRPRWSNVVVDEGDEAP